MNNNNNPRTAQIIDFDNYDPFGSNAPNETPTAQTQTAQPPAQSPSQGSESIDHLNRVGDAEPKGATIFSLNYYKVFFDIQGDQVLQRALGSVLPSRGHLEQHIKSSPDLYGPLWISVTLIVTSAVSHGIAQFIEDAPNCVAVDTDIRRTSFVATSVFLYTFLIPSAIWAFLKYQAAETRQSLPSYMCLYGYSMAAFIPVSILWVIRLPWINWGVMIGATAMSGYALLASLWPSLGGLRSIQARLLVGLVVLAMHAGLAISLGAYAFEPTVVEAAIIAPNIVPTFAPTFAPTAAAPLPNANNTV